MQAIMKYRLILLCFMIYLWDSQSYHLSGFKFHYRLRVQPASHRSSSSVHPTRRTIANMINPINTIDNFLLNTYQNITSSSSSNQSTSSSSRPTSLLTPAFLPEELLSSQQKKRKTNQERSQSLAFNSNTNSNNNNNKNNNNNNNEESGLIPTYQSMNESLASSSGLANNPINNQTELFLKFPSSPLAKKYYQIMNSLTPPELLLKFASTAPKPVQEAAKTTIMNFLGSLPNYALDAALVTTSVRLANLLYQMQITGYMLKNAEYVMSLTKSLKGLPKLPPTGRLNVGNITVNPSDTKVEMIGDVQVKTATGEIITIDVQQLTTSLSKEIQALRKELYSLKSERETELKSNLLTYIQALPEKELIKLTEDMSEEVLQTIQLVVATVIQKLGIDPTGPEMILQQSIGQLAQLCMWQIITGYKLRELEALDRGVPLD